MTLVSVLTATFRPWDMLAAQATGLEGQTLRDIEWIIVDDLYDQRREWVATFPASFPIIHVPPRTLKRVFAAASAWNTGLPLCSGALVYFMNDYIGLSPKVLERHWILYEQYGPDIMVSGPLVALAGAQEPESRFPERPVEDGLGEVVGEEHIRRWYWAGRNDSAPLTRILEANGFDERMDGAHGGQDCELGMRLVRLGCRYLIDQREPCYEYGHTKSHKEQPGQVVPWQGLFSEAAAGRTRAPNDWDIQAAWNERSVK